MLLLPMYFFRWLFHFWLSKGHFYIHTTIIDDAELLWSNIILQKKKKLEQIEV